MAALLGSYILLQPFQTIGIAMVVAIVVSVCITLFFGLVGGGIIAMVSAFVLGVWIIWQTTTAAGQDWLLTQQFSLVAFAIFMIGLVLTVASASYIQQVFSRFMQQQQAMQQQIDALVAVDVTTHFDNEKRMQQEVAREIKRIDRHGGCFTLLFLSFDHHKEFLQAYGEKEMQHLLQALAHNVNQVLRTSDYKYRFNDSKFAFLLVETPRKDVERVIEKLQQQLTEHTLLNGKKVTLLFHISFDEYNQHVAPATADQFISQLEQETIFYAM